MLLRATEHHTSAMYFLCSANQINERCFHIVPRQANRSWKPLTLHTSRFAAHSDRNSAHLGLRTLLRHRSTLAIRCVASSVSTIVEAVFRGLCGEVALVWTFRWATVQRLLYFEGVHLLRQKL